MKSCPVIVTKGKTEADEGEASRIKAILVTTTKPTSSLKTPFTVKTRPKTNVLFPPLRFFPLGFSEWSF
jgi:hypothetical protein